MAGSDVRLRVGAVEGGFAADGSDELPDLSKHKSLAAEVLLKRSDLYPKMKDRQTKLGIRLARCIKAAVDTPESSDTCLYAGDEECFEEFAELFDVVIARMHGLLPAGEVKSCRPQRPKTLSPVKPAAKRLEGLGTEIVSVQLRAARNIRGFRFLPAMDRKEKAEVEMLIAKAVRGLAPAVTGVYLPLRQSLSYAPRAGGMDEFEEQRLKASGTCRDWPHGRGIFTSSDRKMAVWINQQEHLTMMVLGQDLHVAYREMQRALDGLGEILRRRQPGETQAFAWTERLGYLTSDLHGLGCSLEAAVILKLPRLAQMEASHPCSAAGSWRAWAGLMRVQVEPVSALEGRSVEHCFRIYNMDTFNMSDGDVLEAVYEVASRLSIAEHKIQHLSDSDELFPILTSDLSTEEHAKTQSLLSVFSTLVGDEKATQAMVAQLIKANDSKEMQVSAPEEEDINDLKDRVKNAMLSKLNDGSLDEAVENAAHAAGAQYFSDLPPPPPPMEGLEDADDEHVNALVDHRGGRLKEVELAHTEDLSDVRRRAADLLTKAADTGDLGKILTEVKKEMFVELRGKVAHLLSEAADTGQLEKILEDMKSKQDPFELRERAAALLTQAAENGDLERILAEKSKKKEPSLELRQKAANLLTQAAENGDLERILAEKSKKEPSVELRQKAANLLTQAQENAAENGDLERILAEKSKKEPSVELRQKAANLLTQAAENGDLERILAEKSKKEPSLELRQKAANLLTQAQENEPSVELRQKAANLLTQAAENGDLERILAEKSKKEPSVELRQKAANLLMQAAENGDLERILAEKSKKEPSMELRQKAANLLTQAAETGDLERILAEKSKKAKSQELRQKAANMLVQAAADGSLEQILEQKSRQDAASSFQDDIAGIRQAARESLLEAAQNGSLEKVVSDLKSGKDTTISTRQQVAQLLNQAAETGELQAVLREVHQKGETDRLQVQQMLLEASETGKLEEALEQIYGKETLRDVQKRTADLLAEAAANGDLEKVLGDIRKSEEAEWLRTRITKTLVEACDNGLLAQVLAELKGAVMAVMAVMGQSQWFHTGCSSASFSASATLEPAAISWNVADTDLADVLRKRMARAMQQAVEDGNLELALRSVLEERTAEGHQAPTETVDELRTMSRAQSDLSSCPS
ncbi:unnamed protein product [Cladocopium goreaui]|uniref:Arginine kinase n=1 Tax=Cladocopium goreaui TaxID=2562237 RepID=A0A9P1CAF5_9DINO|nr:unnamed protein product [Cladocopium goreaui]